MITQIVSGTFCAATGRRRSTATWLCGFTALLLLFSIVRVEQSDAGISLYRHIDLRGHTPSQKGCHLVLGDLNGDGRIDYLFNDGQRLLRAFDHNGNMLWEKYDPSDPGVIEQWHIWAIAIYDIDADGKNEVIGFLMIDGNHSLAIIDGATGAIERSVDLPMDAPTQDLQQRHIAIANLRGLGRPADILAIHVNLMEVHAYDSDLNHLWSFTTDTDGYASGHYAWPADLDGDGKDEVVAGVDVLDSDGTRLYQMKLPDVGSTGMDHVDSFSFADIDPTHPGNEIALCSQKGIWMLDIYGNQLWHHPEGTVMSDAQEVCVGRFRKENPGLEILIGVKKSNFEALFDYSGNVLVTGDRSGPYRYQYYQLDWDGDHSEDEIFSRNGIFDGRFQRLTGHIGWIASAHRKTTDVEPEFGSIPCDVQGDHREEILFYDSDEIVIMHNDAPLTVPALPSPWNSLEYKLRYANCTLYSPRYINFALFGVVDPTPPNPPRDLGATTTPTSVTLRWSPPEPASDGETASSYEIWRNQERVGLAPDTTFADTGLQPDWAYYYEVYAVDAALNRSASPATGVFYTRHMDRRPEIVSVQTITPEALLIEFTASLDLASAEAIDAYAISPDVAVLEATLQPDGRTIRLRTSMHPSGAPCVVEVAGVRDRSGNEIESGTRAGYFAWRTVSDDFEEGHLPEWVPKNSDRWEVRAEGNGKVYFLKTSSYQSDGDKPGEYSILSNVVVGDFELSCRIKSAEDFTSNGSADFCLIFDYVDTENYWYIMINRNATHNQIFRVVNGIREIKAEYGNRLILDNDYHRFQIHRQGRRLTVERDGAEVFSLQSDDFTRGKVGIGSYNDAAAFDDFVLAETVGLAAGVFLAPDPEGRSGFRQVTLVSTAPLSQPPGDLLLIDAAGATHYIPLAGKTPGNTFTGKLELDAGVADGPATFQLAPASLVDASGNRSDRIIHGAGIPLDRTAPASPVLTHGEYISP